MILKKFTKITTLACAIFVIAFASAAAGTSTAANENSPNPNPDIEIVFNRKSAIQVIKNSPATEPDIEIAVLHAEVNTSPELLAPSTENVIPSDFVYIHEIELSEELQLYTYEKCAAQELDYTLVLALMWRESRFEATAVGRNGNGTNDNGLMQINDVNRGWLANELNINNLLDPYQNIDAGTEILGRFAKRHGMHNALMAYQYGVGGMKRKLEQGISTNPQIEALYEKKAEFDAMLVTQAH